MGSRLRFVIIYGLQLVFIYLMFSCQTQQEGKAINWSADLKDGVDIGQPARKDMSPSDAVAQLAAAIFERHVVNIKSSQFGIDPTPANFGIDGGQFQRMVWTAPQNDRGIKNFQGTLNDFVFAVYRSLSETNQSWYSGEFGWFDAKRLRHHKLKITIERLHRPDLVALTVNDMSIQPDANAKLEYFKEKNQTVSISAKRAFTIKNRTLKPFGELLVRNLREQNLRMPLGHQDIITRGESSH